VGAYVKVLLAEGRACFVIILSGGRGAAFYSYFIGFVLCFCALRCVAESANKAILTLPLYLQQAKYSVGFTPVALLFTPH
jgi:hypothetical protein